MFEIIGVGQGIPTKVITNDDLSKIVDTNDEWIVSRTGIKERHFVENQTNCDLACLASKEALQQAGISKEQIDIVLVATFTPDDQTPSVACMVAGNLGLKEEVMCFDLNAACSGFLYALYTAGKLLSNDPSKVALVIGSEVISKALNMEDRQSCILFGDGAGAVLIRGNKNQNVDFLTGTIPSKEVLHCPVGGTLQMQGQDVYRFATKQGAQVINKLLERNQLSVDSIDHVIAHQANIRIIDAISKKTGIDRNKFQINLDHYGNTSAASIPIALKQTTWKQGETILFVAFGPNINNKKYIKIVTPT